MTNKLTTASFFTIVVAFNGIAADLPPTLGTVQLDSGSPVTISGLPSDTLRAMFYNTSRTPALSCGLVPANAVNTKSTVITTVLEPEPNEDWPSCESFLGGAVFKWADKTGYIVRYRQRDTREDVTINDFFVQETPEGLRSIDYLNGETRPDKKSVKEMASWAKSRLVSVENDANEYKTSMTDTITTDTAFFNVSRNAGAGMCRVNVDYTASNSNVPAVTTPCQSVLATTSIVGNDGAYFIVMTQATDGHPNAQVFVVDATGVREAAHLVNAITSEVATGKILTVRKALKAKIAH